MTETPSLRGSLVAWIPGIAVWAFLVVVAHATTSSAYRPGDLGVIATLYAVFALALSAAAGVLAAAGRAGKIAGAAVIGLALAWHLREQTRLEGVGATLWTLEGLGLLLGPAAIIAAAYFVVVTITRRTQSDAEEPGVRRAALRWLAAVTAFFLVLAATFFGSNTLRWHLLRHNKMLGTTAFHLFAESVFDIEAEAWREHGRGSPVGQPDWIFDLVTAAGVDSGETDAASTASSAAQDRTAATTSNAPSAPDARADVVFIMLDTLRADGLEAYGGDPTLMPELNRFAGQSLTFTEVTANAPWTQPSVASFFTGLVPEEHGIISVRYKLSSSAFTLAEVMQSQGYETAAFITNGVIVNPEAGYVRGFETFQYLTDRPLRYARADVVTDTVAAWLREREPQGRRPLFLYIHYFDPHVPYLSSGLEDTSRPPTRTTDARRFYADELRFLDVELARLLGTLDGEFPGARVVLLASDHGEEFGEHDGRGHSQTLYDEVIDIPVIAQVRDAEGGSRRGMIDTPLEGRDFFDLLVRAALDPGIDVPAWARRTTRPTRQSSLWFEKDPGRSATIHYLLRPYRHRIFSRTIRRDQWHFIWSAYGHTEELYDMAADPNELVNIAAANPELVESLKEQMRQDPRYWVGLEPMDLSRDAMENLRALGYIR